MECTFVSAKAFKQAIHVLKELVQELCFSVSPEGIRLASMDVSHVAFIRLVLPASSFVSFQVATSFVIGMKWASLNKVLACVSEKATLTLTYDGKSMELKTVEKGTYVKETTYPIEVIDVEAPEMEAPEFPSHQVTLCMEAANFQQDCEKLALFKKEEVILTIQQDKMILALPSGGSMIEKAQVHFQDPALTSISGSFALLYLQRFAAAVVLCSTVQLGTSEDSPLYLVYAMEGGGQMTFVLAPKILSA